MDAPAQFSPLRSRLSGLLLSGARTTPIPLAIRCPCTPAFAVFVRSRASIARIRSTGTSDWTLESGERIPDHTVITLTRTHASGHMTQSTDKQPTPHSDQRSLWALCELCCLPPDSWPLGRGLWSVPLALTHPNLIQHNSVPLTRPAGNLILVRVRHCRRCRPQRRI